MSEYDFKLEERMDSSWIWPVAADVDLEEDFPAVDSKLRRLNQSDRVWYQPLRESGKNRESRSYTNRSCWAACAKACLEAGRGVRMIPAMILVGWARQRPYDFYKELRFHYLFVHCIDAIDTEEDQKMFNKILDAWDRDGAAFWVYGYSSAPPPDWVDNSFRENRVNIELRRLLDV